jgi:hypothetical protein
VSRANASVTKKSGKLPFAHVRRACNKLLRATVRPWTDRSRGKCARADAYHSEKKRQGDNHERASRCLGQRWPKILWRKWRDRTPYNEALYMMRVANSGSWMLGFLPQSAANAIPN